MNFAPSQRSISNQENPKAVFYYQYIKPQIIPKEYEEYIDPNLVKIFDTDMIQFGYTTPATCREMLDYLSKTVISTKTHFSRTKDQFNYLLKLTGLDQKLFVQELYDDFPKVCEQLLAKIQHMLNNTITSDSVAILVCSPEFDHYIEKFNLLESLLAQIFRKVGSPK